MAIARYQAYDCYMAHTHKAAKEKTTEYGWTFCVDPEGCAADPCRQAAHGGIVRYEVCPCGATRRLEVNGHNKNSGGWVVKDAE